ITQAAQDAENKALQDGLGPEDAARLKANAIATAKAELTAQVDKAAKSIEMENKANLASADAYQVSEAAGLRVATQQQAIRDAMDSGADATHRFYLSLRP